MPTTGEIDSAPDVIPSMKAPDVIPAMPHTEAPDTIPAFQHWPTKAPDFIPAVNAPAPITASVQSPPTPTPNPAPTGSVSDYFADTDKQNAFDTAIAGDTRTLTQRTADSVAAASPLNDRHGILGKIAGVVTGGAGIPFTDTGWSPAAGFNALQKRPDVPIENLYSLAQQAPSSNAEANFGAVSDELAKRATNGQNDPNGNVLDSSGNILTQPAIQAAQLAKKGWGNLTPEEKQQFHALMSNAASVKSTLQSPDTNAAPASPGMAQNFIEQTANAALGTTKMLAPSIGDEPNAHDLIMQKGAKENPVTSAIGGFAGGIIDPVARVVAQGLGDKVLSPAIGETPGVWNAIKLGGVTKIADAIAKSAIHGAVTNAAFSAGGQALQGHIDPDEVLKSAGEGALQNPLFELGHGALGGVKNLAQGRPFAPSPEYDATFTRLQKAYPELKPSDIHSLTTEMVQSKTPQEATNEKASSGNPPQERQLAGGKNVPAKTPDVAKSVGEVVQPQGASTGNKPGDVDGGSGVGAKNEEAPATIAAIPKAGSDTAKASQTVTVNRVKADNPNIPDWANEEMRSQGKNPNRLLNEVDAARPEAVKQLANDPLTNWLRNNHPDLAARMMRGDLSAKEYGDLLKQYQAEPVGDKTTPTQSPQGAAPDKPTPPLADSNDKSPGPNIPSEQSSTVTPKASPIEPLSQKDRVVPDKDSWSTRKFGHDAIFNVNSRVEDGVSKAEPFTAELIRGTDAYLVDDPKQKEWASGIGKDTGDRPLELKFENVRTGYGDRQDKYGVTGTGHAREVIRKVANLTAGAIQRFKPSVLFFTAAEQSRARLYESLLSRLGSNLVGYSSYSLKFPGGESGFSIVSDASRNSFLKHSEAAGYEVSEVTKKASPPANVAAEDSGRGNDIPKETYFKGDRATFTGKTDIIGGAKFHEVEMQEGVFKGKKKWVPDSADVDARSKQNQADWKDQQDQFSRLRESTPTKDEPTTPAYQKAKAVVDDPSKSDKAKAFSQKIVDREVEKATPAPKDNATISTDKGAKDVRTDASDTSGRNAGASQEADKQVAGESGGPKRAKRQKSIAGIQQALKDFRFKGYRLEDDGTNLTLHTPDKAKVPWNLVDKVAYTDDQARQYVESLHEATEGDKAVRLRGKTIPIPQDVHEWNAMAQADKDAILKRYVPHGFYDAKADSITTSHAVGDDNSIAAEEMAHRALRKLRAVDEDGYRKLGMRKNPDGSLKYPTEESMVSGLLKGDGGGVFDRIRKGQYHIQPEVNDGYVSPRDKAANKLLQAAQERGILMSDDERESFVNDAGGLHPDILKDYYKTDPKTGKKTLTPEGRKLEPLVDEDRFSNATKDMTPSESDNYQQRIIDETLKTKVQKIREAAEHFHDENEDPELQRAAETILGKKVERAQPNEQDLPFAVRQTNQYRLGDNAETIGGTKSMFDEGDKSAKEESAPQTDFDEDTLSDMKRMKVSPGEMNAALAYEKGDKTSPQFAAGVRDYASGKARPDLIRGMTQGEYKEARRGYNAAKEGSSSIAQQSRSGNADYLRDSAEQGIAEKHAGDSTQDKLFAVRKNKDLTPDDDIPDTTGIKNAISASDRERMGVALRDLPDRRTAESMYADGKKAIADDPNITNRLLNELRNNPERIVSSDTEAGVLLKHKVDVESEFQRLRKEMNDAKSSGNTQAETNARLQLDAHRLVSKEFTELMERTGTAGARALASRKMMSAMDYSLSHMEAEREAAKGSPLTREEQDQLAKEHDEIKAKAADLQTQLDGEKERSAKLHADLKISQLKLEAAGRAARVAKLDKDPSAAKNKPSYLDRLIARGDAAGDRLREGIRSRLQSLRKGDLGDSGSLDLQVISDLAQYGTGKLAKLVKTAGAGVDHVAAWTKQMTDEFGDSVEPYLGEAWNKIKHIQTTPETSLEMMEKMKARKAGGSKLEDLQPYLRELALDHINNGVHAREPLIDALHEQVKLLFPDATREQVRDTLSGYGDYKALDKSADKVELRDITQQSQKLSQLEALKKGEAPLKTGIERQAPSDETRALQKQVNEEKKKAGFISTDPESELRSTLDGMKTRTKNLINDLQAEIDTGHRTVAGKTTPISDAELGGLRKQLVQVREAHEKVFGKSDMTDEQRLNLATSSAKKNLESWEKRLDDARRGVFNNKKTGRVMTAPELDAIRAKSVAARAEYQQLADMANPPKSASEMKAEKLQKQIDGLTERMKTGDTSPQNNPSQGPEVAAVDALKKQRDILNKKLADMRNAGKQNPQEKALQKAIEVLDGKIKAGDLSTKNPKQGPDTAFVSHLKAQRDKLNQQLAGMRANDPVLKAKRDTESAERSASEYERKAKEGDFTKDPSTPSSADPNAISRRDKARAEYQRLRDADPVYQKQKNDFDNKNMQASYARRTAELKDRLSRDDYSSRPKTEKELNPTTLSAKADYERAKLKYELGNKRFDMKNRSAWEKGMDLTAKVGRFNVLLGAKIVGKLAAATGLQVGVKPIDELAGSVVRHIPGISKIAEKAPSEGGGFSPTAYARSLVRMFTRGLPDAYKTLTDPTHQSDLKTLYSKEKLAPGWLEFNGTLHSAIKAPLQRFGWEYSMAKRADAAIKAGINPADPSVAHSNGLLAYNDSLRLLFQEKNIATEAYRSMVSTLERPQKETGKPSMMGKAGATAMKIVNPIPSIGTNVVAQTIGRAGGNLLTAPFEIRNAFREGIQNLKPEQADVVMRHLKQGSVGTAALLLGMLGASSIGGFWKRNDKRKEGDVAPDHMQFFGYDIPETLQHHPLLQAMQAGASYVRSESKDGKAGAALASALGLISKSPYAEAIKTTAQGFDDPENTGGKIASTLLVPQVSKEAAQYLDKDKDGNPVQRHPTGIIQNIEAGIPGLRQNVPEKFAVPDSDKAKPTETQINVKAEKAEQQGPLSGKNFNESVVVYRQLGDDDKAKYSDVMKRKIIESRTLTPDAKQKYIKLFGLE